MSLREVVGVVIPMNTYFLWAVHTLDSFEAASWDFGGACDELDDLGEALLVVGLQNLPEPLDNVVCCCET